MTVEKHPDGVQSARSPFTISVHPRSPPPMLYMGTETQRGSPGWGQTVLC